MPSSKLVSPGGRARYRQTVTASSVSPPNGTTTLLAAKPSATGSARQRKWPRSPPRSPVALVAHQLARSRAFARTRLYGTICEAASNAELAGDGLAERLAEGAVLPIYGMPSRSRLLFHQLRGGPEQDRSRSRPRNHRVRTGFRAHERQANPHAGRLHSPVPVPKRAMGTGRGRPRYLTSDGWSGASDATSLALPTASQPTAHAHNADAPQQTVRPPSAPSASLFRWDSEPACTPARTRRTRANRWQWAWRAWPSPTHNRAPLWQKRTPHWPTPRAAACTGSTTGAASSSQGEWAPPPETARFSNTNGSTSATKQPTTSSSRRTAPSSRSPWPRPRQPTSYGYDRRRSNRACAWTPSHRPVP